MKLRGSRLEKNKEVIYSCSKRGRLVGAREQDAKDLVRWKCPFVLKRP